MTISVFGLLKQGKIVKIAMARQVYFHEINFIDIIIFIQLTQPVTN